MQLCPRCRKQTLIYLPWLGQIWDCKNCGYRGPLAIELGNRALWDALRAVPKGKVTTYKALAELLKISPRAVAAALRANPKPGTVPCHRVVHSDGRIGGYAFGGPRRKSALLRQEGVEVKGGKIDLKRYQHGL